MAVLRILQLSLLLCNLGMFKHVNVNGVPDQGGELHRVPWKDIFLSENAPDLKY